MEKFSLRGKVALITASSTGIGFGIANRLASLGARVVISSRNQKNVDQAVAKINSQDYEYPAIGFVLHVGKKDHRESVKNKILEKFEGQFDILVCNAAVGTHMGDIFTINEKQYDKMFDINVKSTFQLCQLFAPHFAQNGSIIIISSFVAYPIDPEISIYSVTKTALLGLTKAMARNKGLQSKGVRVNTVAPGLIRTKFAAALVDQVERGKTLHGITKIGEPDDIGNAVAYLVSPGAKFVNGECLQVAGDITARL